MIKRVTLRDIARIANVSHVTVSLALRKHPSIPAATREKIQKIAKEAGYFPDPALSALMLYRRWAKSSKYKATLAWINVFKHPQDVYSGEYLLYYLGVQERCNELGYQLDEIRLADLGMRYDRLSRVLQTRNIQGLLFAPQERNRAHISSLEFDWEKFSSITFGYTLVRPRLHVVTNAQFRSARLAVRKLRSLGYRRIGYVSNQIFNQRTDGNFLGGYLVEQARFSPEERFPEFTSNSADFKEEFRAWYKCYKPDAILDMNEIALHVLSPEERRSCGIALHCLPETPPKQYAGIHQNGRMIGKAAVDEVISMIYTNERGIPEKPRRILIEGDWYNGDSAPRITDK